MTSSKIKELIDRDKKNRMLSKKLQEQENRLNIMEKAMDGLKQKDRKIDIVLTSKSELASDNEFDTLMKPEMIEQFKKKTSMKKVAPAPKAWIMKSHES